MACANIYKENENSPGEFCGELFRDCLKSQLNLYSVSLFFDSHNNDTVPIVFAERLHI
jgi:hypothetical protein